MTPIACTFCGVLAPTQDADELERQRWSHVVSPVDDWACPKEFPPHPDDVRYDQTMAMIDVLTHSPELAPTVLGVLRPKEGTPAIE